MEVAPLSGPPDCGVISVQPVNTAHIQLESTYNPPILAVPPFRSISFRDICVAANTLDCHVDASGDGRQDI